MDGKKILNDLNNTASLYMAWIKNNMAEPGQNVKGVIVARSISRVLKID